MRIKGLPHQIGNDKQTNRGKNIDIKRVAKPPGKRVSKTGKRYYEYRVNRTDFGWDKPSNLKEIEEPPIKIFNGLRYELIKTYTTKVDAISEAKRQRELNKFVRVVKLPHRKYGIYARDIPKERLRHYYIPMKYGGWKLIGAIWGPHQEYPYTYTKHDAKVGLTLRATIYHDKLVFYATTPSGSDIYHKTWNKRTKNVKTWLNYVDKEWKKIKIKEGIT